MLTLSSDERGWLSEYKRALSRDYPGAVVKMVIYGSKARGDVHAWSDLDVMMLVDDAHFHLEEKLREIGYMLALGNSTDPSIQTFTPEHWAKKVSDGFPYYLEVEREGVEV